MDIKQFDLGEVTVEDVEYAAAGDLAVVNFNQKIKPRVSKMIASKNIKLYDVDVIYRRVTN